MGKNTPCVMKEEGRIPKRDRILSTLVSLRNKQGDWPKELHRQHSPLESLSESGWMTCKLKFNSKRSVQGSGERVMDQLPQGS